MKKPVGSSVFSRARLLALLTIFSGGALCSPALAAPLQTTPVSTQIGAPHNLRSAEVLFDLLNARLLLMRGVALAKWHSGGAIEDVPREKIVMDNARRNAAQAGLDEVEALTRTQIEMAKAIQRHWHRRWSSEGLSENEIAPSLTTVRTQLEKIDAQTWAALRETLPLLHQTRRDARLAERVRRIFLRRLSAGAFTDAQREVLLQAALQAQSNPMPPA